VIPVSILTGALGSGKTTLLRRLLDHPDMGVTAVLVNELGEIGIDHHLLRQVDERTVLLGSGCVCCTMRGDLADELRDLWTRRERGEIPAFRRVVVETTGLADPAPIVYTLLTEPAVRHRFELESVVATVDAVHGLARPEAVKQAAVADALVVTKSDAAPAEQVEAVEERLGRLNPTAPVLEVTFGDVAPGQLFAPHEHDPRLLDLDGGHGVSENEVSAFCLVLDRPVDWTAFAVWLTMLLAARGSDILRIKGLLDVGGPGPLLLNCVQHVVHPPEHLPAWPDDDRRSRLVFIARETRREAVEASLLAFDSAARSR
jgi:G3E family GTPase